MGIIDVKEMEIDYQIPQDYEQSERKTIISTDLEWNQFFTISPPLVAFNLSDPFQGPTYLSAPGSKTVMFYKNNWDVSPQWETTFKLTSTSLVCGRPYRNDCFSYKRWAAYCGDVKVKGMD